MKKKKEKKNRQKEEGKNNGKKKKCCSSTLLEVSNNNEQRRYSVATKCIKETICKLQLKKFISNSLIKQKRTTITKTKKNPFIFFI